MIKYTFLISLIKFLMLDIFKMIARSNESDFRIHRLLEIRFDSRSRKYLSSAYIVLNTFKVLLPHRMPPKCSSSIKEVFVALSRLGHPEWTSRTHTQPESKSEIWTSVPKRNVCELLFEHIPESAFLLFESIFEQALYGVYSAQWDTLRAYSAPRVTLRASTLWCIFCSTSHSSKHQKVQILPHESFQRK